MTLFRRVPAAPQTDGDAAKRRLLRLFCAALLLGALALFIPLRSRSSLRALVDAATVDTRALEPRLSGGFAWAPLRSREVLSSRSLRLASAIGATLASLKGNAAPGARHAAGVAHLLAGRPRQALAAMQTAAASSTDPHIWSDLAATYYATAIDYNAPETLGEALTAADTALAIDPRLPEALFNRALIIEGLGLRDDGRQAWQRYLEVDPGSGWATEGRDHLSRLAPDEPFGDLLQREYESLAQDPAAAGALVRRYPEEARMWGETRVLADWAEAELRHDEAAAGKHLRLARNLGDGLAQSNGDRMLRRAVEAVDTADTSSRTILATAHIAFREGQTIFQDNRAIDAEAKFRTAAAGFAAGHSPVALLARYFTANTLYEQGRVAEAQATLDDLLAGVPADFPAYHAQLLWQRALCYASGGRWGPMLASLTEGVAIFERLGETDHAGLLRGFMAAVYDRTGDPDTAWKERMISLHAIGRRTNFRLQQAISAIAQAAVIRHNWRAAASFLDLEIDIGRRVKDDILFADVLLLRAAVRDRLNDGPGARADLTEAAAVIGNMKDPSFRARLRADALSVQAMLGAPPAEALALLTEAIEFQSTHGKRWILPSLYLQRSHAHRQSGDTSAAAADLERGIDELESHRESLPEGESRFGAFYADEELFADAVDLALGRKDAAAAFAFAERARARSLLESLGHSSSPDRLALPPGSLVVEYMTLPGRLVIFTADPSGIRALETTCDNDAFEAEAAAFVHALHVEDAAAAKSFGTALYRRLIQPIEGQLAGTSTLAVVGTGAIGSLPFAALVDGDGRYLLAHCAVVMAPSAAVYAAGAERLASAPVPDNVLVVSQAAAEADALRYVEQEARQVAGAYASAVRLDGDAARPDALARHAAAFAVIHFAGHAVGDVTGLEPASIVLSDGKGGQRRMSSSEIAAIRLQQTAVVVLAGCSTAAGERRGIEGANSVAHGFLAAGAPSVIATLWPIDDAAAAGFFPLVHAGLAAGLPPAKALRAAQLEWMRQHGASTSLWAAIQTIGS